MNQKLTFEDIVYDATEKYLKDIIMNEIKKRQSIIKQIITEQLTTDYLKSAIKDFIVYDEALGDFIREVAIEHLQGKIEEILK